MERRSAIYSDRAPLVMVTELFVTCVDLHLLTADRELLPPFPAVVLDTW